MIESLLEEPPPGNESVETAVSNDGTSSEGSLLRVLPMIELIVRRRYASSNGSRIPDLIQEIATRLWAWRRKYRDKSDEMSPSEWDAFAARAAYNELNRHLVNDGKNLANISIDDVEVYEPSLEGRTKIEVFSLIRQFWQQICQLSLRQRRALLLHSQELVVYFMQSGITDRELAEILGLRDSEWKDVCDRLPFSDIQIAEISIRGERLRTVGSTARSIKKARYEARAKLEGLAGK